MSFPQDMPLSSALGWALGADEAEKEVPTHHSKPTAQRRDLQGSMLGNDLVGSACRNLSKFPRSDKDCSEQLG